MAPIRELFNWQEPRHDAPTAPWHLYLLEGLSFNFVLGCLIIFAKTKRWRCIKNWLLGCVCGALGEAMIAHSGTLVWEYKNWQSYFIYPPTAVAMMWGLWSALFAELSAGSSPRSFLGLGAREAINAVLLAASIEPLAVRLGWWGYTRFAYINLTVQGVPIVVHVAYFIAFTTLSACSRFWEHFMEPQQSWPRTAGAMALTAMTALPAGFMVFRVYVEGTLVAGDFWALRLLLFTLWVAVEHLPAHQATPVNPDVVTSVMSMALVCAVHGYCAMVGFWELGAEQYSFFTLGLLLVHVIFVVACQRQVWLQISQSQCAKCVTPALHVAEGASLALEGASNIAHLTHGVGGFF